MSDTNILQELNRKMDLVLERSAKQEVLMDGVQRGHEDLITRNKELETRVRVLEDWKANLGGKLWVGGAVVAFVSSLAVMVVKKLVFGV